MGGKALQIIAVHLHAVAGSVDRFQKAGKALTHQLFAADLALFQLFPELFVDGAVGLHRLSIRLNAVIDQRFRQSLALGGIKVQKCIVRVKQDAIIFCHCVPLSHWITARSQPRQTELASRYFVFIPGSFRSPARRSAPVCFRCSGLCRRRALRSISASALR